MRTDKPTKACPILLRLGPHGTEVLAFEHPLAGFQLVKGTIAPGESPEAAAVREMHEEAGIQVRAVQSLGVIEAVLRQAWSLTLCEAPQVLPDHWVHRTADDGGHLFRFFWHPLAATPADGWAEPYRQVLAHCRHACPAP